MTFVYIVRCNFSVPAKEQAWNDWYSGAEDRLQMLRKPHFLSCQRFRRAAAPGGNYLALWVLQSPEAFKTKEYTSDWGFFEWQPCIIDWSRDLFEAGDAAGDRFRGADRRRAPYHVVRWRQPRGGRCRPRRAAGHDVAAGRGPRPPYATDRGCGA